MTKIFDPNNGFWRFMGKLVDATILHFVWLVCCLPIVTFGASTTALYYAMTKDIKDEDGRYVRAFFRSFKLNFKQGTIMGLIFLLVEAGALFSVWFYNNSTPSSDGMAKAFTVLSSVMLVLAIAAFLIFQYAFPLLARFDNSIANLLKYAFYLTIKNFGWSVLMAAIFFVVYVVVLYVLNFFPILIIGYGLVAYLNSFIINHIFDPIIRERLKSEGKLEDPDAWVIPDELEENAEAGEDAQDEADRVPETPENADDIPAAQDEAEDAQP